MLWNKKQEGKMEARPKEQEIVTAVTISEVMVDGLWVIDLQGRTIDVNSAMAKMLGYENRAELIKKNPADATAKESLEVTARIMQESLQGKPSAGEINVLRKDGKEIPVSIVATAMRDIKGKLTGAFAIMRDITERKHAEEALNKSLKDWQITFDSIPDFIFIMDNDNMITMINFRFAEAFNLSPEEMIGKKCYELFHKSDKPYPDCPYELTKKDKLSHSAEINDPNIKIPLMVTTGPIFNDKNEIIGAIHVAKDITELKEAENALEESAARFRGIVLLNLDAIIVTDAKGKIEYMNPAAEGVFNRKVESFIGKDFGLALVDSESTEIDIFRPGKDPGVGDMHVVETEWLNKKAHLIIIRDITERKRAEAALAEAVKIKMDFTGMVSHELRTPLAVIKEGVSVVLEKVTGDINEEQAKYLSMAKNNVDRLDRLISAVLDFQTLESRKMEFKMEDSDMNEIVKGIQDTMMTLSKKKGLTFEIELCDDLPQVKFDRDKIIQVLTNLVNNALKFTEKGSITISTSRGDNFIQVMVKDTGIGVKEENMQKLFQEFTQLQRKVGGTGLGLSICKKLIEAHKGKIWAESEFGKGTAFYFNLPIKERRV